MYSPDPETHLKYLTLVFQCLVEGCLKLKELNAVLSRKIFNIQATYI